MPVSSRRLTLTVSLIACLTACPAPTQPAPSPKPSPSPTLAAPTPTSGGSSTTPGPSSDATSSPTPTAPTVTVSTIAGSEQGFADGPALSAKFDFPTGLGFDRQGNLYVAEQGNVRIRRLSPDGQVSTIAGSEDGIADGPGSTAKFMNPNGLTVAADGTLYVADAWGSNRVRRILPSGLVETLAGGLQGFVDGQGAAAQFYGPRGLAASPDGSIVVADTGNHCIRRVSASGIVVTLVGGTQGFADGIGSAAQFNAPTGVAIAPDGTMYVADSNNDRIRKVTPSGKVSTFAGSSKGFHDGNGSTAQFNTPAGMALDPQGNLYVADAANARIRKVTPDGTVSTIAGAITGTADGPGNTAQFNSPFDVAIASNGDLYVADQGNHRIRRIRLK